jgi:signal transduction histidine kinase
MRTLSARIVLGFAVLIVAFAVIVGSLGRNAAAVEEEVQLIGNGYLPFALDVKDLQRRQDNVLQYLKQDLADINSYKTARNDLVNVYKERDNALGAARRHLDAVENLADLNPTVYNELNHDLQTTERAALVAKVFYFTIVPRPPISTDSPGDPRLTALIEYEQHVSDFATALNKNVRDQIFDKTKQLERNEHLGRLATIYLGLVAVVLGLLVATWAVINLRPLARLRVAARQVGGGDYKTRIPETGPAEVADLARELNSMSRAIEERERELVRSERLAAVGKMAAMITHEVRNPLSSIALNTELLEDELAPDAKEGRALCRAITHEVDRLTAITEEYLAFARLPKPKITAESVNTLVTALAQFVREDLGARKVDLVVEADPRDPIALVDPAQLRQCLINLVRNAADAVVANGGGHVWLRTRRTGSRGDRVAIEVADDGTGIAEELLPKLFDQFFSTKDGGSGLGLALTQQIVKDHGGELAVESTVGRGTTFTVTLPAGVQPA